MLAWFQGANFLSTLRDINTRVLGWILRYQRKNDRGVFLKFVLELTNIAFGLRINQTWVEEALGGT